MTYFFLHGMGGGASDWTAVRESLPGIAVTIPTESSFSAAVDRLAAQLREETAPFSLIGYSMGGRVATAVSERLLSLGNPPARLVLVSAGLGFRDLSEKEARFIVDERWVALAERDLSTFWREWYAQPLFASFAGLKTATQSAWLTERNGIDSRTLTAHLRTYSPARHEYLLPILKKLQSAGVDLLYMAGELDPKYVAVGQVLAGQGISTVTIPNAGHALPLEAPRAVAEAIRAG